MIDSLVSIYLHCQAISRATVVGSSYLFTYRSQYVAWYESWCYRSCSRSRRWSTAVVERCWRSRTSAGATVPRYRPITDQVRAAVLLHQTVCHSTAVPMAPGLSMIFKSCRFVNWQACLLFCVITSLQVMTPWRNGSASDSRSEGCVFKSRRGHGFFSLRFCSPPLPL